MENKPTDAPKLPELKVQSLHDWIQYSYDMYEGKLKPKSRPENWCQSYHDKLLATKLVDAHTLAQRLKEGRKYLKGYVCRKSGHAWMEMDGAIEAWFDELIAELEKKE